MARKKKDTSYIPMGDDQEPKQTPDESSWGKRLSQSKAFQKKYSNEWDKNKRLIFNSTDADSKSDALPAWMGSAENSIAYGWGLYQGLETSIYVQNPDVMVTARDPMRMPIARQVTHIVRYDNAQMDVKSIGNLLLLDTFIAGYGVYVEDVKTYHQKEADKESPDYGKPTGEVKEQEFEGRRIDYKDVLFDRNAKKLDLSDSRYIFIAWYPTIDELRNDPEINDLPDNIEDYPEASEYTRTIAAADETRGAQGAQAVRGGATGEKDPAFKTICVWEIFDKINHRKLYMTDEKHKIVGEGKWPVDLKFGCRDLFPITLLYQHPIPGRFYPMPEASLIAPQLSEINVLERMISEDTRTKWRKYLTLAGILTEDQKSQVTDTTIANALIYVDLTKITDILGSATGMNQNLDFNNIDLRKLVVPMEDVSPKKDLFQRYDMLEKIIQHIVGYGPAARGGMPSTRSAREAMMINQENQKKLDKRKDHIADFYQLISMKHVRFLQRYMSVERYAKIFSKVDDLKQWFAYNREDILGDFEFEVLAGTTVPKNTEARKASEMELFKTVMAVGQGLGPMFDPRPAFYRVADFYDWDGVDALFGGAEQKAEALAVATTEFHKGKVPPEALLNTIGQALMAWLGPAKLKALAERMQGGEQGGGGQQQPEGSRGDPTPQKTAAGVL